MKLCCISAIKKCRFDSLQLFQLLVAFIFLAVGGNAFATSFSADLVKTEGGKTQTSQFLLRDHLYRLDVVEDGHELIILVNRETGKTRIVIPAEKQYREIKNSSFLSVMNNPFEAYNRIRKDYESRTSGTETIAGIRCNKEILSDAGQDLMTAWVARPYDFPIRIENPATGDRVELQNITEGRIDKAKFQVPAGYTEKEDPARKRAREEAALPFLTTTATGTAPWARRIGPSGEMRVAVDPEKSVRIKFENFTQGESVFTIKGFRSGQPIKLDCRRTTFSLKGKGRRDECLVGPQNNAEEISVIVEKGKIIAEVFNKESSFSHEDKTETFFIATGIQNSRRSAKVDSKRQLRLKITSDSQDGSESKITVTFYKDQDRKDKADEISAVIANGKSKTWDYLPENGIKSVKVDVAKGGGVQVILEQPAPGKKAAVAKKRTVKKAPQYKPKVTDVFTVTHPYGTSKPLAPGKDLVITVTGLAAGASGKIDLYTDRQKTKKIDTFSFKLRRKQSKSYTVPGSKSAGWATVWVSRKSFKVKLDQSPGAKAVATAPPKKKPRKTVAARKPKNRPVPSVMGEEAVVNGMILNGTVPIMDGMKLHKQMLVGASGQAHLEVQTDLEAVINFYKKAMTAKGWKPGMTMIRGSMGVLQLTKGKSKFMLQAEAKGQKSIVIITLAVK